MYTVGEIPRKWARLNPNKECMVCTVLKKRFTWKQFNERVNKLANGLLKLGLEKGDMFAILMENNHIFIEFYYAMAKTGIVPVPLNWRWHANEIKYALNHSDSIGLVIQPKYKKILDEIKNEIPNVKNFISIVEKFDGLIYYDDLLEKSSIDEPNIEISEEDLFFICYTGGTTGFPKAAKILHKSIINTCLDTIATLSTQDSNSRATTDFSTLFVLPAFHISVWPVFVFHYIGAKVVISEKLTDMGFILKTIQDEKIAHMNAVPTLYNFLLNFPDISKYDLSSLKLLTYAGAPFPQDQLKQCVKLLGPIFSQGLGATEGMPWTMMFTMDHNLNTPEGVKRFKSCGRETLLTEIKICDEQGNEVPAGEVGELRVRTKSLMSGYWKDPEKTKDVLKNGWYCTGDMGKKDEDEYIYLIDRKSDLIKSGGEKVYPFEVENVLYKHPSVDEAIVVGIPDPKWGQKVHAAIHLKKDFAKEYKGREKELEKKLIDFCHEHLTAYKCPKSFEFWKQKLPKTPVGKPLRKEIKKQYE